MIKFEQIYYLNSKKKLENIVRIISYNLYKEKTRKILFLDEDNKFSRTLKKKKELWIIIEYSAIIFQKLSSQSSTSQLQLFIVYISTMTPRVESFREWKEKKKKRIAIVCNVFRDCVPRLTLNAYEGQGGGRVAGGLDTSPRHLSERRPGEYRSVNERSPFPLARTQRVPTTTPSPIGGSKVWRPWRPDGVRKNGEGHGFRVPEPMRNRRRESESKGDRADHSLR